MTQWGEGALERQGGGGGGGAEGIHKTKQLQSSIAVKEEMVEEGGLNLNISSLSCFWAHCHRIAFSLLHRKEWI